MTGWLLDTNVISEWRKPRPEPRVIDFLSQQDRTALLTSVICIAEIRKGLEDASDRIVAHSILRWLDEILRPFFGDRLLQLSEDLTLEALRFADDCERRRQRISVADVWIAATACVHGLTVVTRNTKDLVRTGVPVLNPWTGERFNGT